MENMVDRTPESETAVRKAVTAHPRLFEENRYVYPVLSRRSRGLSIGVNLNPDKVCNFDCIYCQVDRDVPPVVRNVDPDRLLEELRSLLGEASSGAIWDRESFRDIPDELKRVNDIAFSGDGEPTTYPGFLDVIRATGRIKQEFGLDQVKTILITNCTRFHRPEVRQALEAMHQDNGEIWAKLDAGTQEYYDLVERSRVPFDQVLANLRDAAARWPLVIQSLFMRIREAPPPPEEVAAYCDVLKGILDGGGQLKLVQAYTVARRPAEPWVASLSDSEMDALAQTVREHLPGVPVEVFYGARPDAD
jgi:wyosine [tRNA(Phe)-imidazoG37] synthetase (radical SAM superfamily)